MAAAILTGCDGAAPARGAGADVVYTAANVRTVDPGNPRAEAIAVEDGRITVVGSEDEAMAAAAADTEIVDLGGRSVVPGFHDVHVHAVEAGRFEEFCFLPSPRGARFYVRGIRRCAREQRGTRWVRGSGPFVQDLIALGPEPRELLDRAVPDRPVVINDALGHAVFVNSEALRTAGLADRSGNPRGGAILRDRSGRPNGVLLENAH